VLAVRCCDERPSPYQEVDVTYDFDEDALMASADLITRSGAREFQFGWLDDDVPIEQARWYAKARWGGEMMAEEDHVGPVEAADALARRVIAGGMCVHCMRRMALGGDDPETCPWERQGRQWVRGCLAEFPEGATVPTSRKLASALTARGAPVEMIQRALHGYYDDFKSPLAMPELQLLHDARAAGMEDIAQMVIDGKFDATKEESEAWAASPEGQATFAELLSGAKPKGKHKPRHQGRYTPPKGKR
jgi:hypothetical protein